MRLAHGPFHDFVRRVADLLICFGQIRGHTANTAHHFTLPGQENIEAFRQLTDFIGAAHLQLLSQVATTGRNLTQVGNNLPQRAHNSGGEEQANQSRDRSNNQCDHEKGLLQATLCGVQRRDIQSHQHTAVLTTDRVIKNSMPAAVDLCFVIIRPKDSTKIK